MKMMNSLGKQMVRYSLNSVIGLLNPDNTISADRFLSHAIGMTEAVIYSSLISKHVYYAKHGTIHKGGWFYSTIEDLQESTTFGAKAQRSAIERLIENGLIECKRMGMPAVRFFRISTDLEKLNALLDEGRRICAGFKKKTVKVFLPDDETEEKESVLPTFVETFSQMCYAENAPDSGAAQTSCYKSGYHFDEPQTDYYTDDHDLDDCSNVPDLSEFYSAPQTNRRGKVQAYYSDTAAVRTAGYTETRYIAPPAPAPFQCPYADMAMPPPVSSSCCPQATSRCDPPHIKTKDYKTKDYFFGVTSFYQSGADTKKANAPSVENIDERLNEYTHNKSFADVLKAIGADVNDFGYNVPKTEADLYCFEEKYRNTQKCEIPYILKNNRRNFSTALRYLSAYSYYSDEDGGSEQHKLIGSVIDAISEMVKGDHIDFKGGRVMYYEIIDRLNEVIREDYLSEWLFSFAEKWKKIVTENKITNRRAYMKSCIWSWLCDYPLEEYNDQCEIDAMFGGR